jgi:hypothetical protein
MPGRSRRKTRTRSWSAAKAAVITKTKGGICHLDDGIIKQAHSGGSYRPMEWGNTASTAAEIDCKKVFR